MAQYIISYIGGEQPKTQEEGEKHFTKYKQWLESTGDAMISPANPFKNTHTVKSDGSVESGSLSCMSGYSIIEADSIETALEITKSCPFLEMGGTLEVSELMQMST